MTQKRIGWFIPVITTRRMKQGKTWDAIYVPPLLSIDSISNDGTALSAADYITKPDDGAWTNGPFTSLLVNHNSSQLHCWSEKQDAIVIAGRWGKYERSGDTGATIQDAVSQNDSQLTLLVDDCGKVSPGMVLLIEDEQETVIGWGDATASVTTLNGGISANDEVITVDDGSVLNVGEVIRCDYEKMRIRDKRADQISVIRGWDGTGRVTHANEATLDVFRTVKVERVVNGTSTAIHLNGTAISRYFAPDDIQYLTKQIATLIVNKAKGGYQGRSGNAETGNVFYNDVFPRFEIDNIAQNYYIPSE
jgi:hypothetical protein